MFRLVMHKLPKTGDADRVRIRHKPTGMQKIARLSGCARRSLPESDWPDALGYQIVKSSRELLRDLLYRKYGSKFREVEFHHWKALHQSIESAGKRMH